MKERKPDMVSGLIDVRLDGYSGKGPELVSFTITATGLHVTLRGELAMALQLAGIHTSNLSATVK